MRYRYKIGLIVTVLLMALCLMTYQSYALWIVSLHGEEENVVDVGCFKITFEEIENTEEGDDLSPEETVTHKNINLTNTYPMSDTKGLTNTPYTFKIKNTCSINSKYHVTLNTPNTNTLDSEYIKFALYKSDADGGENAKPTEGKKLSEQAENKNTKDLTTDNLHFDLENLDMSYLLDSGILKNQEEVTYNLILWIDEGAGNDQMGKKFEASVNVINAATGEQEVEEQTTPFPGVIADSLDESGNGLITQEHGEDETFPEGDEGFRNSEYRFVGSSPNNYVNFNCDKQGTNCELWQIIGLVNVKTESGITQRVKLIRNGSIGEYAWDSSETNVNNGDGINEWSESDLMKLLNPGYENNKLEDESGQEQESNVNNSLYWSKQSGKCYSSQWNESQTCDFTSKGMKDEAKQYIADDIIWNTGTNGENDYKDEANGLPKHFYEYERSNNTRKICSIEDPLGRYCNDEVERKLTWQSKENKQALVGLMYPSDFGYAVGGVEDNREQCLKTAMYNWNNNENCYTNNWLYKNENYNMYTLTSFSSSSFATQIFYTNKNVRNISAGSSSNIYPVVYLAKNVIVKADEDTENPNPNGSENHPFILTMGE